jgi:hypothetical protein
MVNQADFEAAAHATAVSHSVLLSPTPDELSRSLVRSPGVRDLTLLGVSNGLTLVPLTTASLAGLKSLTVREVGLQERRPMQDPALSPHALHAL